MRFGSVCSGIEAASVAWHPLGWKAAWLSEIEPFPSAVLAHHYPDVPNLGDMTLLPERILSGEVEAPDLFCGGTPCQAFSVAGLRNSLDDARGNLSLTFVGIGNAIDHVRSVRSAPPAIIFWENVPGVLSTKDNAFGCFLAALAGEDEPIIPSGEKWTNAGCVYGPKRAVAWRCLDAQYFGVAQRRRRVFVVASARADFDPAAVLFEFNGVRRDTAPSRETGQRVAGTIAARFGISRNNHEECIEAEAMVVTARKVALGEYLDDGIASTMKARDYKEATDLVAQTFSTPAIGHIVEDDVASTMTKNTGGGGETQNPAFVAQPIPLNTMTMQGRPSDEGRMGSGIGEAGDPYPTITKGHSHAVAQPISIHPHCIGRAPNAGPQGKEYLLDGSAYCMDSRGQPQAIAIQDVRPVEKAQNGKGWNDDGTAYTVDTHATQGVAASMRVRRLTPVECERLQGFPDNYTNIPWRKKLESPDGPRYKALGNSWAVPVVAWIGKRIQEALNAPA